MVKAICLVLALLVVGASVRADDGICVGTGEWYDLAGGAPAAVLDRAAQDTVVLLGEIHDNPDHHRWQLQTMAALHARVGNVALGFEMFPRRVQPVLDRWVAGDYDEAGFLEAVGWNQVWGFDAELYMPLFHFARMNRLPMVALNVDRTLIAAVGEVGWDAVPSEEREGVGDPAVLGTFLAPGLAQGARDLEVLLRQPDEGHRDRRILQLCLTHHWRRLLDFWKATPRQS